MADTFSSGTKRMKATEFFTSIINCARCKGAHEKLEFKKFRNPIEVETHVFTHWALCPTTEEPIVLEVTLKEE